MKQTLIMFWKDICWSIDDVFERYFELLATIGMLIFTVIFSFASFLVPLCVALNDKSPWILLSYLVLLPVNIFLWLFITCLREHI